MGMVQMKTLQLKVHAVRIIRKLFIQNVIYLFTYLANNTCPQENFSCDHNKCISKFWVCDGDNDCDDKTDEKPELCDSCLASQFACGVTRRCIPHSWVCDGTFDCGEGDTSDEHQYCGKSNIVIFYPI